MTLGHTLGGRDASPSTPDGQATSFHRLPAGWRVQHTTGPDGLDPAEWDRVVGAAGGGFYLSHAWLSSISGVDGFAERTLLVRDAPGDLVAALNIYTIERATNPLYNPHKVLAPDADPLDWEPQLVVGSRSGYSNGILATTDEGYAAVAALVTGEVESSDCGSAAMMYLATADARRMAGLIPGAVPVLTGFRTELAITFDSFGEYLVGLSRNRRAMVRRDLRRFEEAGCRVEVTSLAPHVERLAPLLGNVQRNHGVDIPDELHAGYLRGCAGGRLADQAVVFQCFEGDALVGFSLAFRHHGRLTMRVTGLDYARTTATGAHFALLCYEPIRYAVAHGLRTVDLGTEGYRTKLLRGGRLVPLWSLPLRTPDSWKGARAADRNQRAVEDLSASLGDLVDVHELTGLARD